MSKSIKKTKVKSTNKVVKNVFKKEVKKTTKPKPKKVVEKPLPEATIPTKSTKEIKVTLPSTKPIGACILKIMVGKKYYIAKTHNIEWLGHEIEREVVKFQNDKLANLNKLYAPIVVYAVTNNLNIVFNVLFESTSGYQCMKFELEQLEKNFGKKNCLNQNNIPHIPKTAITSPNRPNGYVWLTANDEINFRKLLKKYTY
jgi:hypothetical protein